MNQKKKTIFISYGRDTENPKDIELVKRVKNDLENAGFEVLIDEEQLRSGSDWEIKLENMIKESNWILFFITPYSARRPEGFCLNELAMSLAYKKPIVPIMVNYEVPPLSICRLQYLDLQTLKKNEDYHIKLQEILGVVSGEKELGFEGGHLNVLNKLNPIKFDTVIAKHVHGFIGRVWIKEEVDKWLLQKDSSRVLWIRAEAGFGKSAIATYLATKHQSAIGIYFCQYDYPESRDPREMLKVLIYELSTQLEEYNEVLLTLNIEEILKGSTEHIFSRLMLEPLNMIKTLQEKQFFVIDALDEAVDNGKNGIVELISNRFIGLPSWLNIVITSRSEPEISKKLKKFDSIELKVNDDRNFTDMQAYLSENKKIQDKFIRDVLARKSEGNILYLKSIFKLDIIKKEEFIVENIQKLPHHMEDFYLKYFERKFDDISIYEEKYLDFVSLLVAQEGLPEILVQDILGLSEREYKKIKSNFGSLLEDDKGNLSFYHKTIYEWLSDYNKSGNYSADIEMAREKFHIFLDSVTAKSYKDEYLEFELFNRNLIDRIYEIDKNLERFFEILKLLDNDKKKMNALDILGTYYFLNNNDMYKAIELFEGLLRIVEPLYQNNSDAFIGIYTALLNKLALTYKNNDRVSEAIKLQKKSYNILKKLYKKCPESWKGLYAKSIINLVEINSNGHFTLLLEGCQIIFELYSNEPEYWVEDYTNSLNLLASSFQNSDEAETALMYQEESLEILEGLYKRNPKRWVGYYLKAINGLVSIYKKNKLHEGIKLQKYSVEILKGLYFDNHGQWGGKYAIALSNLVYLYGNNNISETLELQKQSVEILKDLYGDNPEQWGGSYSNSLKNLALLYRTNNIDKAIRLQKYSLNIMKRHYATNPNCWEEDYAISLSVLALLYGSSNKLSKAIELQEQSHNIIEKLYEVSPKRWKLDYNKSKNNLESLYTKRIILSMNKTISY